MTVPVYEYTVIYDCPRAKKHRTLHLVATDDHQARLEASYAIPCGLSDIVAVDKGMYLFDEDQVPPVAPPR